MRLKRLYPAADGFEHPEDGSEPDLNRAAERRAFPTAVPEAASAAYLPLGTHGADLALRNQGRQAHSCHPCWVA
jgi:hypothetical protein